MKLRAAQFTVSKNLKAQLLLARQHAQNVLIFKGLQAVEDQKRDCSAPPVTQPDGENCLCDPRVYFIEHALSGPGVEWLALSDSSYRENERCKALPKTGIQRKKVHTAFSYAGSEWRSWFNFGNQQVCLDIS